MFVHQSRFRFFPFRFFHPAIKDTLALLSVNYDIHFAISHRATQLFVVEYVCSMLN